jgi:hypothetical protein
VKEYISGTGVSSDLGEFTNSIVAGCSLLAGVKML